MADAVEVAQLSRVYSDGTRAVEGLSFTIRSGEIFTLLGPNGAGKTTTIRLLAGLIQPSEGWVRVQGMDTREPDAREDVRNAVGVLPEQPGLYEQFSAARNLLFYGRLHGLSDRTVEERIRELSARLDLGPVDGKAVGKFSKGMKQRVALARALLHRPSILVLDEPMSGLDPESAKSLRDYLLDLRRDGTTIILSTHNLDDADRLSDRIAMLRSRLIAVDTPSALKARLFGHRVAVQLERADPAAAALLTAHGARGVELQPDGRTIELELDEPDRELPELLAAVVRSGYRLQYVRPVAHSLEEAYLKLLTTREGGS